MRAPVQHLLSICDLSTDAVDTILERARAIESEAAAEMPLRGRVLGLFFMQPSTRTRLGFAAAAARLGAQVAELRDPKFQPGMSDQESIEDTIHSVGTYFDLLVVRHEEARVVEQVAACSAVPIISGGAGHRYHPTQALIDLHTIRQHLGHLDSLKIGIAGDLRTSRTGHSLLRALARYQPREVRLLAPPGRGPDAESLSAYADGVVTHAESELDASDLDVLYMAGMPPGVGAGRLSDSLRAKFFLDPDRMARLPKTGIVLCALPRTGDIHPDVDRDPRALYFSQSQLGLSVRMAILENFTIS